MRPILVLTRKSLLLFFQNRAAVTVTIVVPMLMIYLFGHVFGLYGTRESGPSGIRLAVVNLSPDPAAAALINALRTEKAFRIITDTGGNGGAARPLTEADVRTALHNNDYRYALIIPEDLISTERFGVRLRFLSDPRNEIESQTVNGLLQRTIFAHVPQLLTQSLQKQAERLVGKDSLQKFNHSMAGLVATTFGGDPQAIETKLSAGDWGFTSPAPVPAPQPKAAEPSPPDPTLRRLDTPASPAASTSSSRDTNDFIERIFKFETEQVAGKSTSNPMAARLVGGYAIMFLLFAVSGSATTMFEEKNSGIFQRILSAPVRPAQIVWSRFIFGVILGLIQMTILFLAGRVFYHLDIISHMGTLFVLSLAAAAACTSFGMLLAAVAPSGETVQGLATLIVMTMSAIGGAWFPISFMPEFIQKFSKLTIVYWAVEGFTGVLWAGQSLVETLPTIGILSGITLVVMMISLWFFKRSSMFT